MATPPPPPLQGPFVPPEASTTPAASPVMVPPSPEVEALRREMDRLREAMERERSQGARERALLKVVQEQSPQGIVVCDAQGQFVMQNQAAERIWAGAAQPGSERWGHYEAFHTDGRPYEAADWATARVLRSRSPVDAEEMPFRRWDGSTGVLLSSCAPLVGNEGLLLGAAWVFQDISHLKQVEAENALLLHERTRFLNLVSHELGNTITPLSIHVQLLKEAAPGELGDESRRSVEVLERNVERLQFLVQDVMDAARLQTGKLPVALGSIEVGPIVVEAVETFQEQARRKDVALEWQGTPGLTAHADPKRVTQVLFNLLSNALKFTPGGGRIMVEAARAEGEVVVHVRDTGRGLDGEDLARLFQPFTQVHETNPSERREGTGLGLYISKGLIELHGGRIWAESAGPGKGATFSFTLPAAEARPSASAASMHAAPR